MYLIGEENQILKANKVQNELDNKDQKSSLLPLQ